jgi:hypothetical protein
VLLLAAAHPDKPWDSLADVPVGERDAKILDLRSASFGRVARAVLNCPNCSERLEFTFDSRTFLLADSSYPVSPTVEVDGWKFRIPSSRDVARIAHEHDVDRGARALLKLCWVSNGVEGQPEWSDELLETVEARMGELDPQGDLNLDFNCEQCGHGWQTEFDITGFFWDEIEVCAKRLLEEVHVLAGAYGWSEHEVLALSDVRRSAYIDMVTA